MVQLHPPPPPPENEGIYMIALMIGAVKLIQRSFAGDSPFFYFPPINHIAMYGGAPFVRASL